MENQTNWNDVIAQMLRYNEQTFATQFRFQLWIHSGKFVPLISHELWTLSWKEKRNESLFHPSFCHGKLIIDCQSNSFKTNELNNFSLAFAFLFFCYKNMHVFGVFLLFIPPRDFHLNNSNSKFISRFCATIRNICVYE